MKSFIGAVIFICVALSANAQLLWKVSGNGLSSPSYIMGTHHLAPLSVKDGIAGLQKAMDEGKAVIKNMRRIGRSKNNTLALITQSVHDAENDDDRKRYDSDYSPLTGRLRNR